MKLQEKVFELLERKEPNSLKAIVFRKKLALVIIVSTAAAIWETVPTNSKTLVRNLDYIQNLCSALFAAEYLLRLWVAPLHYKTRSRKWARIRHAFSPMMLIDLAVLLPFALPYAFKFDATSLRILRLVRIMRIARFGRFSKSMSTIVRVIKDKAPELTVTVAFTFLLLVIASTGIYHFEKSAQPHVFTSIPQSMWWSITTLIDVWYGDVRPITFGGKIFAGLVALLGISTIALPSGIIAGGLMEALQEKKCEKCGEPVSILHDAA